MKPTSSSATKLARVPLAASGLSLKVLWYNLDLESAAVIYLLDCSDPV